MQGNRNLIRPVIEKYFPTDYATILLDGREWDHSTLVCTIAHLERVRRPRKDVASVVMFLKTFIKGQDVVVDYLAT